MFTSRLDDYTTLRARLTVRVDNQQNQTTYDLHLPTDQCDLATALIDDVSLDGHPVQLLPGRAIIQSLTTKDLDVIAQYLQGIWKQTLILDPDPRTKGNEQRIPVTVERENSSLTFHVAQNTEFLQGVADGRQLLPTDWDLTGKNGLWEVEDVFQFIRREISPAHWEKENEVCERFDTEPHTPIYNLGLVAGLLSLFAEAALQAERRDSAC